MKKIIFILALSNSFLTFSQDGEKNFINSFEQYQDLFDNPNEIYDVYFNLFQKADQDSIAKYGVRLEKFINLSTFNFACQFEDSLLEAQLFSKLGVLPKLKNLSIRTKFQHQFQGFNHLKSLTLEKEVDLNNSHLASFQNILNLGISTNSTTTVTSTSSVFELPNVETIEVYGLNQSNFPFEKLSSLKKTHRIQLVNCQLAKFPESWGKLELTVLTLTYSKIDSVSSNWICNSSFNDHLDMQISVKEDIVEVEKCIIESPLIQLKISVEGTFDKKTMKQLRKLRKKIKRINKSGNRKNEVWFEKIMEIHTY